MLAWPLALTAIVLVPAGARIGVAAFGLGMAAMFTCSALLHLRTWPAVTYERFLRLDHSGIFLAIGGTGVAVAELGLHGWPRVALLAGMLVGVAIGITVEWLPFAPPRGFNNAVYLTLGWVPVALLPWIWMQAGALTVVLMLVGGIFYTVGAVIVGMRRPDPWPRVFGFHEIFHALVIAAVIVHAVMLVRLLPS